ncbi:unnamed protein product, partial [Effrenium voratum]
DKEVMYAMEIEVTPPEVKFLQQRKAAIWPPAEAAVRHGAKLANFAADISLLLSEIPYATAETINKVNKLICEMKRTRTALLFPAGGIYDSATRNISSLHGLRSGRAGYELTLAVSHALKINTAQLADCLTKGRAAKKMMLDFM